MPDNTEMKIFIGTLLLSILPCTLTSISLDFRVIPSVVDPIRTKNMTLLCTASDYNHYENNEQEKLSSLRILKNYQDGWRLVAQISDLEPNNVYINDESITYKTGQIPVAPEEGRVVGRLAISWSPVTSSNLGQYKCLTSRYTIGQNRINSQTSTISLGSKLDALAILRVMKGDRDEITAKMKELTEKAERYQQDLKILVDEDLSDLKEELILLETELNETLVDQDKRFGELRDQVFDHLERLDQEHSARLEELDLKVQHALGRGFLLLWPRGTYALPTPISGCPAGVGVAWGSGSRKQHTESAVRNKDEVSEGNHLAQPVRSIDSDQNNFVYQRFCVKTDSVSPGPTWPAGTYCINKKGACPAFFTEGTITWDDQRSGGLSSTGGVLPDGQYFGSNTTFVYCCRDDRPADEPINLPRSQPFFLYRRGGQCQQIAGMNVGEEFMRFDTQSVNNRDAATGNHPDITLNDVVLQLCYYEQAAA